MEPFSIEQHLPHNFDGRICGIDEAGRGCLAGPLYAAAVILDQDQSISFLADSKQISPDRRQRLADEIRLKAFAFGIGTVSAKEIDDRGIEWANRIAFSRAVRNLLKSNESTIQVHQLFVCIDGTRKALRLGAPQVTIPKGDQRVPEISAASILAKTSRDRWVVEYLHQRFPHYGFDSHKGYATKQHIEALRAWGPTPYHRRSFHIDLGKGGRAENDVDPASVG